MPWVSSAALKRYARMQSLAKGDAMPSVCLIEDKGAMPYVEAWDMQRRIHSRVVEGKSPDVLMLVEHPHVYTLGRRGKDSDILLTRSQLQDMDIEVHRVDRGGEVTYHGPGQLVGYPVINLRRWGGGPLKFVQSLERTLIATLAEFGINAESQDKPTGVWVGEAKIAAIGVRVSKGVTMHGFALNVCPDLSFFEHIVPCGMPDAAVTSLSQELDNPPEMGQVVQVLYDQFGRTFGMEMCLA